MKWKWVLAGIFCIFILILVGIFCIFILLTLFSDKEEIDHFQISTEKGNDEDAFSLLTKEGTYYIAWFSERSGTKDIWMKSSDNGLDWSEPYAAIETDFDETGPKLLQTSDGTLHMTWTVQTPGLWQYNIWHATSDDGITWVNRKLLTEEWHGMDAGSSVLQDSNGRLWVFFVSDRTLRRAPYSTYSDDGGETWSNISGPITQGDIHDDMPVVSLVNNTFHLIYVKHATANLLDRDTELMYTKSKDGIAWEEPVQITNNEYMDSVPVIVDGPDGHMIIWIRADPAVGPRAVAIPLSDPRVENMKPLPGVGYATRTVPLEDNKYLLTYVRTIGRNRDIYGTVLE